jgi:hypothetical protein
MYAHLLSHVNVAQKDLNYNCIYTALMILNNIYILNRDGNLNYSNLNVYQRYTSIFQTCNLQFSLFDVHDMNFNDLKSTKVREIKVNCILTCCLISKVRVSIHSDYYYFVIYFSPIRSDLNKIIKFY